MDSRYDVVVIGGGAAGLSGATLLARSRRSVLVIDAGEPRNAPADGVHNFLTRDGMPPAELTAAGQAEVRRYGGQVTGGRVASVARTGDGFEVRTEDGRAVPARRLLVTTGLTDELPPVPGLRERWGRDVLHCPFCHGWEVRDQPIGVLARNAHSVRQALLFRQLSEDITFFAHGLELSADEAEQLAAWDITVVAGTVTGLVITDDQLAGVQVDGGSMVPVRALTVAPDFNGNGQPLAGLGLEPRPHPSGVGLHLPAGPMGQTNVPGVYAAGNVTDPMAQVVSSAAAGMMAASALHGDLLAEDTAAAVAARRELAGSAR